MHVFEYFTSCIEKSYGDGDSSITLIKIQDKNIILYILLVRIHNFGLYMIMNAHMQRSSGMPCCKPFLLFGNSSSSKTSE